MAISPRWWFVVAAGLSLGTPLLGILCPAAAAPVAAATETSAGPKSRLPYPADADVWADAAGMPNAVVPAVGGGQPGMLSRVGVLVFRPKGDNLGFEELTQLYTTQSYLAVNAKPLLSGVYSPSAESIQNGGAANKREARVYRTRTDGVLLVLLVIRNQRSNHELAAAVLLHGKLDSSQAIAQANGLVDQLAEEARRQRETMPTVVPIPIAGTRVPMPPSGATPAGPTTRIEGPHLQQMLAAIVSDNSVSPRVKEMARSALTSAKAVNYSTWRTVTALNDGAFIDYYVQQAVRLGWGPPISRDETQPGRPTLLFQRPHKDGMVMVRAQTAPVGLGSATTTTIILLDIDTRSPER